MARSQNKTNEEIESLDVILNDENVIFTLSFGKMDFEDVQPGPSRQLPPRDDVAIAQRQSSPRREEQLAFADINRERAGTAANAGEVATLAQENAELKKRIELLEQKLNRPPRWKRAGQNMHTRGGGRGRGGRRGRGNLYKMYIFN
ncbi:hypothetical protein PUN28_006106 [Cardiocondyla obscurior]|uniref:Uncharacterized protein n=1 Tax=Cardiocondyla obscurior TaxID=286306 RepID=A0AAW2GC38_9HYME